MTFPQNGTFKGKDKMISPEELLINTKYSITLNPNDKRQYFGLTDRISKLRQFIEQQLLEVPNVKFYLHMEISRNGRLHFHGTIVFTTIESIKHFYIMKVNEWQDYYQIDMDTIKDEKIWNAYCVKSKSIIDELISTEVCLNKYRKVKMDKNGICHKSFFE